MKIELTIYLDIPEVCREMCQSELSQLMFDTYVNYVTCCHFRDSITWLGKTKKLESDFDNKSTEQKIYEYHNLWGETTTQPHFQIRVLN